MDNQEPRFSLKDHLFNRNRVSYLADLFHERDPDFDAPGFVRKAMLGLADLELKQRITHIAIALESFLDPNFRVAAQQITKALPPPLDPTRTDDDFGDFIFAPLGEFVVRQGMAEKWVSLSLRTLKEITQRFSMEYAIRAFINAYPQTTLDELKKWATDKNYHVRRLVSEGTRPSLPWSGKISIDPMTVTPILGQLHADPTRYVTRSVANHLNDLSKINPDAVLKLLTEWQSAGRQSPTELQWIAKHALRTLIKRGHPPAMEFLGFATRPKIKINDFQITPSKLFPGESVELHVSVTAQKPVSLVIDYVIDFPKANGKRSQKVHKLKQIEVVSGETILLRKRHPLRANATTFKLYPGTHHVTLQINGQTLDRRSFELLNGSKSQY